MLIRKPLIKKFIRKPDEIDFDGDIGLVLSFFLSLFLLFILSFFLFLLHIFFT